MLAHDMISSELNTIDMERNIFLSAYPFFYPSTPHLLSCPTLSSLPLLELQLAVLTISSLLLLHVKQQQPFHNRVLAEVTGMLAHHCLQRQYLHSLVFGEDSGIVGGAPGGITDHIGQIQNSISLSCTFQANVDSPSNQSKMLTCSIMKQQSACRGVRWFLVPTQLKKKSHPREVTALTLYVDTTLLLSGWCFHIPDCFTWRNSHRRIKSVSIFLQDSNPAIDFHLVLGHWGEPGIQIRHFGLRLQQEHVNHSC